MPGCRDEVLWRAFDRRDRPVVAGFVGHDSTRLETGKALAAARDGREGNTRLVECATQNRHYADVIFACRVDRVDAGPSVFITAGQASRRVFDAARTSAYAT